MRGSSSCGTPTGAHADIDLPELNARCVHSLPQDSFAHLLDERTRWFPEREVPFGHDFFKGNHPRPLGWMYQQVGACCDTAGPAVACTESQHHTQQACRQLQHAHADRHACPALRCCHLSGAQVLGGAQHQGPVQPGAQTITGIAPCLGLGHTHELLTLFLAILCPPPPPRC